MIKLPKDTPAVYTAEAVKKAKKKKKAASKKLKK